MIQTIEITFLTVLEAGKSKIKVSAGLVSDKSSFMWLETATFLMCVYMASSL